MGKATTPEQTSTRVAAKDSLWTEPSDVSETAAPDLAMSARTLDMETDVHATISTTAMTEATRGVQMGDVFHGQCDPDSWVDVTTELTYQGPDSLDTGGVLTVSLTGDGRNEYRAELVSTAGSAADKLSAPDERCSKRRWSMSWTVTDRLEPGDDLTVSWRMTGAEAADPGRGTHADATFLYPAGQYAGLEEAELPWIGAPTNATGTPGTDYSEPTRFFGFVADA